MQARQILAKLNSLSPERRGQVEDFIDSLGQRDGDERLRRDYAQASEDAFGKAWDNDEDAVYDTL